MEPNRDVSPPDERRGRWNGLLKTLAVWALIVFLPLAIFQLVESERRAAEDLRGLAEGEELGPPPVPAGLDGGDEPSSARA